MRRLTSAILGLVFVSACGANSSNSLNTTAAPKAKRITPLEATLLPPTHGWGFYVNKSAYVALFDIVPGGGIGLIYPHMGRELNDAVRSDPQWINRSVPYMPATFVMPSIGPVHYLFMVASREPLRINDYVGYSDYLREKLGNIVYTGNAYTSMHALIEEVVAPQPDEDWTTALYIVYGGSRGRVPDRIYQLVRCPDGQFYWVELGRSFVCEKAGDTPKAILNEDPHPKAKPQAGRGSDVLLFEPNNAPAASDLLRRPVTRVDRPPMAPEPRSSQPPDFSSRRGRVDMPATTPQGGGESSGSGSATVTTPAQQPSNPRGRVTDGGSSAGQTPQ